jgi:uncharacterized protein YndB with AHSA1/START domain
MIDIASEIGVIEREAGNRPVAGVEGRSVLLRRSYDAPIEDVWDAVTDPDRLKRWFLPVSGELKVGGAYQLEGNAGGEILACEPPRLLRVSFGGPESEVELRLTPDGDLRTSFELEHAVPAQYFDGSGALAVGPGWDGAVMGLGLFLRGEVFDDPVAAASSREVQEFSQQSVYAWAAVVESAGIADEAKLAEATKTSVAHFAPDVA